LDGQVIYSAVPKTILETGRERCFLGLYRRARANVASLVAIRNLEDFRALARLTRSLFELVVEVKLLDAVPDAVYRIEMFSRLEQLRSARKIIAYSSCHPEKHIDSEAQRIFIAERTEAIETECKRVWPSGDEVEHWSGMTLRAAIGLLNEPFVEIVDVRFPKLLWYTNSDDLLGLSLTSNSYQTLAATHIELVCEVYNLLLESVRKEFDIPSKHHRT
jgi:hypothetical protein